MGGLSVWRGKFTDTSGKVVYDKDAKSGSIEVTVNMNSVDFGLAKLDEHAKSPEIFDAAKISDGDLLRARSLSGAARPRRKRREP